MTSQVHTSAAEGVSQPRLQANTAGRPSLRPWAAACALLCIALAVRLCGLDAHHFWDDELMSLDYASGAARLPESIRKGQPFQTAQLQGGLGDTLSSVIASGGNGVVYYLALNWWSRSFGKTELTVRLPSAFLGVAVVGLGLALGLELLPRGAAWAGAALLVIHPLLVRYSQEARAYALATCLVLLAAYAIVRLLQPCRPGAARCWALLAGAAGGLAFLSHYLTAGVLIGLISCSLLARPRVDDVRYRLLLAAGAFGVLTLAWLLLFVGHHAEALVDLNARYVQEAERGDQARTLGLPSSPQNLFAGLSQTIMAASGNRLQQAGFRVRDMVWLLAAPLFLGACGIVDLWKRQGRDVALLLILCGVSSPTLSFLHALLSGHTVLFQVLYVNFASPFLVLLLAAGAWSPRTSWPRWIAVARHAATALVIATMVVSLPFVYWDSPWYREKDDRYSRAAWILERTAQPGDEVAYNSWWVANATNRRLSADWPTPQRVDPQSSSSVTLLRRGVAVWSLVTTE